MAIVAAQTNAMYSLTVCTRAQLLLKRDNDDDHSTIISSHSSSSEEKIRAAQLVDYESRLKVRTTKCFFFSKPSDFGIRLQTIHENHATSLYFM